MSLMTNKISSINGVRRAAAMLALTLAGFCPSLARDPEILWDKYGVPHIYADDDRSLFHAFGYAQMESHGDLLLHLYGEARGRAAEYWGEKYVAGDRWVLTNSVPQRAARWYQNQDPGFRRCLDAFAEGINEYARDHPGALAADVRQVLPVSAIDVLAHAQRVVYFLFVANPTAVAQEIRNARASPVGASNAWAVSGSRTRAGKPLLLANPHLSWSGVYRQYEAQLSAPGVSVYGATLVGFPVIVMGFNGRLGWAHTVNTFDGQDLYELKPATNGYVYDGVVRPYETTQRTLRIRQSDGTMREHILSVRTSIHGPVISDNNGKPIAMRVAGLDQSGLCKEWWDFARARNLTEFEAALKTLQIPTLTVMYADSDGHILHLFGGRTPVRPKGDWRYWHAPVPGDTSATLWTTTHPYEDLPRVLDPPSGWLQNANDPPWTTTFPLLLDPAKFPSYMAPDGMTLRAQASVRLIQNAAALSLDDFVKLKHSTRSELADRILGDLIQGARASGNERAQRGAAILEKWDHTFEASSRGAVLFGWFALNSMTGPGHFEIPWSRASPLDTPRGLKDVATLVAGLGTATGEVEAAYGAADVPYGDVVRLRSGDVDLPANGGPTELGVFRAVSLDKDAKTGRFQVSGGDSFVYAAEFSTPIHAQVLIPYGNWSQPGSAHESDQLALFARKELRPAWLTKKETLEHLERREHVPASSRPGKPQTPATFRLH
jgi:acyl-homoserine-lactone acylase